MPDGSVNPLQARQNLHVLGAANEHQHGANIGANAGRMNENLLMVGSKGMQSSSGVKTLNRGSNRNSQQMVPGGRKDGNMKEIDI